MKTKISQLFISVLLLVSLALQSNVLVAQNKNDSLKGVYSDTAGFTRTRDSLLKVYAKQTEKQKKEYEKMMEKQESKKRGLGSSLFGVNLDIIFGVGFASAEFDVNTDTSGLSRTTSKAGPMAGVNVNINLLGFAFSTGFSYSSKGFTTSNNNAVSANYINIPLMFAFNFDISKVQIDIAAGPYVGILLSHDTSQYYSMKNIDIGIVGTLQGSYFFNRFMGTVLGVKYERGGLNNLLETGAEGNNIRAMKTQNWFIYTGMKFVL